MYGSRGLLEVECLLGNTFPLSRKSRISDRFTITEGDKDARLLEASSLQGADDPIAFGYVGVAVTVDENHLAVVGAEAPQLVDHGAVHAPLIASRIADSLIIGMLHRHAFAGDSETILQSFLAELTDTMLVAPLAAVVLILTVVGLPCHVTQVHILGLLILRIVTVAERNVEVLPDQAGAQDRRHRFARVGRYENPIVSHKADR